MQSVYMHERVQLSNCSFVGAGLLVLMMVGLLIL